MRILVAEDEVVTRFVLEEMLTGWDYQVVTAADGDAAWEILRGADAPALALPDWELPGLSGPEICSRVRALPLARFPYLLLVTHREGAENVLSGLRSGANDFLTKPVREEELAARLHIAAGMVRLQQQLAERVAELEDERERVKQLRGLLPICAWCKKIRSDQNYWHGLEEYLSHHSDIQFSHGICPPCLEEQKRALGKRAETAQPAPRAAATDDRKQEQLD